MKIYLFYVYHCLPPHLHEYHELVWCPGISEEGAGYLGAGIKDGCEPPRWCWESNLGPLQEQCVPNYWNISLAPNINHLKGYNSVDFCPLVRLCHNHPYQAV